MAVNFIVVTYATVAVLVWAIFYFSKEEIMAKSDILNQRGPNGEPASDSFKRNAMSICILIAFLWPASLAFVLLSVLRQRMDDNDIN